MASLDSLPADQRAVLQLVLQRGRSYDEIAAMLSIDRAAVRQRALDGFDQLGPNNSIPALQRALLTDYLLGQLPPKVADRVRERLGSSPPDRAWARVIASEIGPLSSAPLPEIPVGSSRATAAAPAANAARDSWDQAYQPEPERTEPDRRSAEPQLGRSGSLQASPPSSRRGGAVILALVALAVAAIVVVVIATSGSSAKKHTVAGAHTATTAHTSAGTTTGTSTTAKVLAQINLTCASDCQKTTAGVAQVVQAGKTTGVVIVGEGLPANTTHDAYAVWLSNGASSNKLLGFVSTKVAATGKDAGKLQTEGELPSNASSYSKLYITLETQSKPTAPGQIVLEGAIKLSS